MYMSNIQKIIPSRFPLLLEESTARCLWPASAGPSTTSAAVGFICQNVGIFYK